jgi:hypothetical protein
LEIYLFVFVIAVAMAEAVVSAIILSTLAATGKYLSRRETEQERRERQARKVYKRASIDKSRMPSQKNAYSSDRWRETQLEERRLANQYWRNSHELGPERTNIVPAFWNTLFEPVPGGVYTDGELKPVKKSSDTILPQGTPLGEGFSSSAKERIANGPMFSTKVLSDLAEPDSRAFSDLDSFFAKANAEGFTGEISPLTGLPMEAVHNNMVPNISEKNAPNLDHCVTEQKLETFTGTGPIIGRNKQEVEPMFELFKENIYGTPNQPEELRKERLYQSNLKTNVLPGPQVRVRSVKPEYIRPRFFSVDELRTKTNPKVEYNGRIQGPAKGTSKPGIAARVYKRGRPKYFNMGQERFIGGRASVSANKMNEDYATELKDTARANHHEQYFTPGHAYTANGPKPSIKHNISTERELRTYFSDDGNSPLDARFEEPHRDNFEADSMRNVSYTNKFVNDFSKNGYLIPVEERETTNYRGYEHNADGTNSRYVPTERVYDKPKTTHRQTRQSRRNGNLTAKNSQRGGYLSSNFYARPTHKETTHVRNRGGPVKEHVGNQTSREQYMNSYIRGLKESTITAHTPGRGNSKLSSGACDTNISIRSQLSNQETIRPMRQTRVYEKIPEAATSVTISKGLNKLPVEGKTLFDPVTLNQLNRNPFALKPNHPRR